MNLLIRSNVEHVLSRFQAGELGLDQAVQDILDMPQISDFEGIWELLIIHICLSELAPMFPQTRHFQNHWKKEISAWQQRLKRFLKKPKASFRNAVRRDFEQAHRNLFKDDAAKLLLNVEIHLEEILNLDEISVSDPISAIEIEQKPLEWFLAYQRTAT